MATQVQLRRGTAAQNDVFTGAVGEVTYDSDNDTLRVHDGGAAGGYELAKSNLQTHTNIDINSGTIDGTVIGGSTPAAISGTTGSFSGNLTVDTNTLFVDAANNRVGVGTNSPQDSLHIAQASAVLRLEDTDTSHISTIQSGAAGLIISADATNTLASSFLALNVDASERLRITSAGSVGIGTTSPERILHTSGDVVRFDNSGTSAILLLDTTNNEGFRLVANIGNTGAFSIEDMGTNVSGAGTERLRLDSSGNLIVGATAHQASASSGSGGQFIGTAGGFAAFARSGDVALYLNRISTDGIIQEFRKDGTIVGSIGSRASVVSYIAFDPRTSGVNGAGLTGGSVSSTVGQILPTSGSGALDDAAINLGDATTRFKDIFATNGTIQTSDRNEKQDIEELDEAERRVAVAAKGLLRKFRWKDAVAKKGDDARIHFGIIAQDLQAAFEAEGLDAGRYAMFIHSTWTDEETGEERSRMGVRYPQLLAFIIAAI
jgi:hypothetical protein